MSNRLFPGTIQCLNRETKVLSFTFFPNGASNPVFTSVVGQGIKSIVHTATGVWTITLQDQYPALLGAFYSLNLNAIAAQQLQWGAINVTGLGGNKQTLVLNCIVPATAAASDIAANANNKISVTLFLKNVSGT